MELLQLLVESTIPGGRTLAIFRAANTFVNRGPWASRNIPGFGRHALVRARVYVGGHTADFV